MSSKSNTNRSSDRIREKRRLTTETSSTQQQSGNVVKRNKKSELSNKVN